MDLKGSYSVTQVSNRLVSAYAKQALQWLTGVCVVLWLCYALCAGCVGKERSMRSQPSFNVMSADVKWVFDADGNWVNRTARIEELPELRRLLAFFPGLGTGKVSPTAGGWKDAVRIQFNLENGTACVVGVNSEFNRWTEGQGDWSLAPGFEAYINSLVQRQ